MGCLRAGCGDASGSKRCDYHKNNEDYTERDRKLWMFLVAAVWDDLESQTVHEIKVSKINAVFEAMGGRKTRLGFGKRKAV